MQIYFHQFFLCYCMHIINNCVRSFNELVMMYYNAYGTLQKILQVMSNHFQIVK